jgi:hypothetical protein
MVPLCPQGVELCARRSKVSVQPQYLIKIEINTLLPDRLPDLCE